jgi:hypothetical protein
MIGFFICGQECAFAHEDNMGCCTQRLVACHQTGATNQAPLRRFAGDDPRPNIDQPNSVVSAARNPDAVMIAFLNRREIFPGAG